MNLRALDKETVNRNNKNSRMLTMSYLREIADNKPLDITLTISRPGVTEYINIPDAIITSIDNTNGHMEIKLLATTLPSSTRERTGSTGPR